MTEQDFQRQDRQKVTRLNGVYGAVVVDGKWLRNQGGENESNKI